MSGDLRDENRGPFKRRHWSDSVLAVAALFVSAISLWVGIRTEDANEQLVTASTWPFLSVGVDNATPEGVPYITFVVANSGVGPARIVSFEVFWRGKAYRSGHDLVADCCGLKSHPGKPKTIQDAGTGLITGSVQGMVLRSGDTAKFIAYPLRNDNAAIWNALDKAWPDVSYRICYCSVLNKCALSTMTSDIADMPAPNPVAACPVPKVAYGATPLRR